MANYENHEAYYQIKDEVISTLPLDESLVQQEEQD